MGFLGRKTDKEGTDQEHQRDLAREQAAIGAFWVWWPEVRRRVEAELAGDGISPELATEITVHVHAINNGLAWDVGIAGDAGQHQLVVTAGGIAGLRSVAERWCRQAPADAGWVYRPARPADPGRLDGSLMVNGWQVSPARTEIAARVDQRRAVVDVVVYHPVFGDVVEDQPRNQLTALVLDWLLGEDDVERWLGEIGIATDRPLDTIPASALPDVVAQLASMYAEPRWALLSGQTAAGQPVIATARFPLRRVDYPLFDQHVAVVVPYRDQTPQRLPAGAALESLRAFEEELVDRVAQAAVLVAHESANGRRILHLYTDSAAPATATLTELARAGWREGRVKVLAKADPAWSSVAHLRP